MQEIIEMANRPPQVLKAVQLLWFALGLGLFLQLLYFGSFDAFSALAKRGGAILLMFAIHGYLILGIARGRNSARWISFSFFVGGLFFAPPRILDFAEEPVTISVETIQASIQAIAFILLFTTAGKSWFTTRLALARPER